MSMNTGAQKHVIQRVWNRTGVVLARSAGEKSYDRGGSNPHVL
jgi:hypothetical protein